MILIIVKIIRERIRCQKIKKLFDSEDYNQAVNALFEYTMNILAVFGLKVRNASLYRYGSQIESLFDEEMKTEYTKVVDIRQEAVYSSHSIAKEQRDLSMLVDQIERISNGELTATTDISKESAYYEYSQKLTNIGQGMEKALETQMKGERMKIDLITNVSHDLKTPLTSIIGYVDLLSRDQTLSAESRDYVTILINKTERLKSIISDLFELAKATSGDAKVDLEEMDMKRLVEQTLGDMADQIEESGFAIRYQCEATHTRFIGDSSRMYRVVQNVIENALKYSLKGTRIFLRITEADQNIKLEVINTASYEMNFTEEEIMERFARAEKSRTSEGNGLGLSIADSFTKNCGGEFSIRIDGDQFLVTIQFKQYLEVNK